ncbi:MAG: 2-isopropylmalate synthase [Desulfohalobiaceae bacterium]|nr:2-isopropylmalate synthase [Desulfohalobiaceae bacterium]
MSERMYIFDTTLRDGEQSPGASMNLQEKRRLARQLDRLGVDVIEAGFPASSQGEFESVQDISAVIEKAQVAALSRCSSTDIDRAWEAIKEAKRPRIHTFLATSNIHMQYKLNMTREQVLQTLAKAVTRAAGYTENVEFSAEDASRSDPDFLVQVLETAISSGATTVNIPDTVGYTQPQEFFELISYLRKKVSNIDKAVISVHCHNDLGLAVANTLAALDAGARQAEVTLNGIGERAGNAALEEVIMALKVREDIHGLQTGVDSEQLYPACRLLSMIIGQPISAYKAVVGGNAFAHEAGIHQHGMIQNKQTYEIMTPDSIGRPPSEMVMGKHSGRHACQQRLEQLGYRLEPEQLDIVFAAVKRLADIKKQIFVEDLEALVLEEVYRIPDKYKLLYLSSLSGNMAIPTATLKMVVDGQEKQLSEFGVGPIDAVFNGISRITGRSAELARFSITAITGGTDAQGEVTVKLEEGERTAVGRGSDPDIIVASAKAYINALNRLAKREEEKICVEL